jgi:signal transduction histidine kinase
MSRVVVVDRAGTVLAFAPGAPDAGDVNLLRLAAAQQAMREERPVVASLVDSRGVVQAFVPLSDRAGEIVALIVGEIPVRASRFGALMASSPWPREGQIEIVDAGGTVIAATDASRLGAASGHGGRFRQTLRAGGSGAGTCSSCHERRILGEPDQVAAMAPIETAPWIVSVRQPVHEAYAAVLALRRGILLVAPVMLLLGVTFAYGVGRSVVVPVAHLTRTAERLADGALDQPIAAQDEDEVGRLARSLERMRLALKTSLDGIAAANQELEQRVQERTAELQSLYGELQKRQRSRTQVLNKVISVQEEERKRIARELHDQACQTVAALLLAIDRARGERDPETLATHLSTAALLADQALDELHQLIYGLRPSVLDDLGLPSAVRWCAERSLGSRGVSYRCEFSGLERRLTPAVETAVFRVIQEAITNVERHARAEAVLIQCSMDDHAFAAEIEDDGVGFVTASAQVSESGQGLGLLGMRERVDLLGGTMDVDSAPGRGTRITFSVPVAHV